MRTTSKYALIIVLMVSLVSCNHKEKTSLVRKNIQEAVFGNGSIEQSNDYVVSASASGIVEELPVTEGDEVNANALIAIIKSDVQNSQLQDAQTVLQNAQRSASNNSPEIAQIEAQISQAQQQLTQDKTNYLRYKELRANNSVSQLDLDNAKLKYETSQENLNVLQKRLTQTKNDLVLAEKRSMISVNAQKSILNDYRITADNQGKVIEIYKKRGEFVRAGDVIAKIGSGDVQIKLYISEDDINKIEIGQKLEVNLNTYSNSTFSATITKILPGFNDKEQSYEVEAAFDKVPDNIFSGTQLQANIETKELKNVLVIPASYLIKGKYVELSGGSQKEIKIGAKSDDWVEIVSGLSEEDVIVKNKN